MFHLLRSASVRALSLACVASSPPALAQQTAAPFADVPRGGEAAVSLSESSVSATGVPTPIAQTGSSVTALTSDPIAAQQRRTVPDALQQVPGPSVVQTGGPGGQTSAFIRGSNANHGKVLIDGIDATDPSNPNGSFDFGRLPTDDLSRVEVLRGRPGHTVRVAPSTLLPFIETRLEGSAGTGFKAPTPSRLVQNFPAFTSNENVGRATSYGAQAFVSVRVSDTLSGRIDDTNAVTGNEITGQELLRRPRHKGSATAFWAPRRT